MGRAGRQGQTRGAAAPSKIELPAQRRLESEADRLRYQQDLICALIGDFAAVLGGKQISSDFATLADDSKVWRNIEHWRRRPTSGAR